MKRSRWVTLVIVLVLAFAARARAQGAPDVVWEAPTPNGLANSVLGVAWSPHDDAIAVGSTDRWVRARVASTGALRYSTLEPHRSGGVRHLFFSRDGVYLGVVNQNATMAFLVHRASDGVALGSMVATLDENGIVGIAPDESLQAVGDGTMSQWRLVDLTFTRTTGTGYRRISTTFTFSNDGRYQAAASRGTVLVQRRIDGSIVAILEGALATFAPDGETVAVWRDSPNAISLHSTQDGSLARLLATPIETESIGALRFSPDGQRIASSGYEPYVDADGLWQQKGVLRFWRVADAAILGTLDARTDLAITSPVAWSPDGSRFAYGRYDGGAAVARTPD